MMMFEFSAGSPALCLVDTFGDRAGAGIERLASPDHLHRWLSQAGLIEAEDAPPNAEHLEACRQLREAIHGVAQAIIDGRPLPADFVATINRFALFPAARPQFVDGTAKRVAAEPVFAALSALAADAITVMTVPARGRIRSCPECRMIFFDTSRPGRRRWCSSVSGCGNRAKVRAHRARRTAHATQGDDC